MTKRLERTRRIAKVLDQFRHAQEMSCADAARLCAELKADEVRILTALGEGFPGDARLMKSLTGRLDRTARASVSAQNEWARQAEACKEFNNKCKQAEIGHDKARREAEQIAAAAELAEIIERAVTRTSSVRQGMSLSLDAGFSDVQDEQ